MHHHISCPRSSYLTAPLLPGLSSHGPPLPPSPQMPPTMSSSAKPLARGGVLSVPPVTGCGKNSGCWQVARASGFEGRPLQAVRGLHYLGSQRYRASRAYGRGFGFRGRHFVRSGPELESRAHRNKDGTSLKVNNGNGWMLSHGGIPPRKPTPSSIVVSPI